MSTPNDPQKKKQSREKKGRVEKVDLTREEVKQLAKNHPEEFTRDLAELCLQDPDIQFKKEGS